MRVRAVVVLVVSLLVVSACGDDSVVFGPANGSTTAGSSAAAPTTSGTAAVTTAQTGSSSATETTGPATTASATTTAPTAAPPRPPSGAAAALDDFFGAAVGLDADIRDAAGIFNAGYDESAATVSSAAAAAIDALDATPLSGLIPPGLSLDLETAVLGVYADLNSRVAALQGAVRLLDGNTDNVQYALDCLENGGFSARRFDDDLDRAIVLAAAEPVPTAVPDSIPAGVLAVRLEAIRSMNFGCDSCGGIAYTEAIPIDWDARTVLDGVGFEAAFDGSAWQILIYAC